MREKHLTELPWKTLVAKQGVKDLGLGKALAAYTNLDATKEPAKALEGAEGNRRADWDLERLCPGSGCLLWLGFLQTRLSVTSLS
jgi:hypothetical protein